MNECTTKIYRGWVKVCDLGESTDILQLFEDKRQAGVSLAESIEEDISDFGHFLTVRYWTSDQKLEPDQIKEEFIKKLYGLGFAEFDVWYSEITGYLFTKESLEVGGHDLLVELKSVDGRYLHMEIDYCHNAPQETFQ
jgi:hypothetical protein